MVEGGEGGTELHGYGATDVLPRSSDLLRQGGSFFLSGSYLTTRFDACEEVFYYLLRQGGSFYLVGVFSSRSLDTCGTQPHLKRCRLA